MEGEAVLLLVAQSRHFNRSDECPLLAKSGHSRVRVKFKFIPSPLLRLYWQLVSI